MGMALICASCLREEREEPDEALTVVSGLALCADHSERFLGRGGRERRC